MSRQPTGPGEATEARRVLFVDNFDSFTYNLVEYVSEAATAAGDRADDGGDVGSGAETVVLRNTASLGEVRAVDPDAVVISPGPGHPENDRDIGVTMDVLREVAPEVPTLGVCLGLEAAVYAYGGDVGHAPKPVHGKAVAVQHDGQGVYAGLEQGFRAGRYHSLIASQVPDALAVTATAAAEDGTELVMGVRHREHPLAAVQFHPESVLTPSGHDVVENFLASV
ncbi:MAG: anthranilate synthase component II [Halobacteriales archaeon]